MASDRIARPVTMPGSLTFILGLCGAGKSYLIRQLDADLKFDEGFAWNLRGEHEQLVAALRANKRCAVIEVAYCLPGPRETYVARIRREVPGLTIHWKCFENDLGTANKNCRLRLDRDPELHFRINDQLSAGYTFPEGAEVLPIWSCE